MMIAALFTYCYRQRSSCAWVSNSIRLSIFTAVAFCVHSALTSASDSVPLRGRIIDADGKPISTAVIVVRNCRPESGVGRNCSWSYPECKEVIRTDNQGRFELKELRADLMYSLAVGASGFQGSITDYVAPNQKTEIDIQLKKVPQDEAGTVLSGRVLNQEGKPIANAVARVSMWQIENLISQLDPRRSLLAITDSQGNFTLEVGAKPVMIRLRVSAYDYAPAEQEWNRSSPEAMDFQLVQGAAIAGQLQFQNMPVPAGIRLGIVQANLGMENIVTPAEIVTDEKGRFRFDCLPPDQDYSIYTSMEQAQGFALPVTLVKAPWQGEIADLGTIEADQASPFAVTVQMPNGKTIPENGTIYIGRDRSWHGAVLKLPSRESSYTAKVLSVAAEDVNVTVNIPGYKVMQVTPPSTVGLNRDYRFSAEQVRQVTFQLEPDNK